MSLIDLFPSVPATITTAGGSLSASDDFEVLALALEAADLTDTLAAAEDFTLFAPTDAAFAALAVELGYTGDPDDADSVFATISEALADLSTDDDPTGLLTEILLYHVAPGEQTLTELEGAGDVPTLLTNGGFEVVGGTIVDDDPDAQNGDVIASDVNAGDGLIQVVDQVLLPLDTPVVTDSQTLLDQLKESGGVPDDDASDFDLLLSAVTATGLDAALDDPDADLTVFAPNDQAFLDLAIDLGFEGEDESGALQFILDTSAAADPGQPLALLTDILSYHVLGEERTDVGDLLVADEVQPDATAETLLTGSSITIANGAIDDLDTDAENATVLSSDGTASNGSLNTLDAVLRPIDLPQVEAEATEELAEQDAESSEVDDDDDDDGLGIAELFLGLGILAAIFLGGGLV